MTLLFTLANGFIYTLDNTFSGGTGAWAATWYAKLPDAATCTLVESTTTVPHAASCFT
jgi:hypothetical protein